MKLEEKLKERILSRYKSVRAFSIDTNIPYSVREGSNPSSATNSKMAVNLLITRLATILFYAYFEIYITF